MILYSIDTFSRNKVWYDNLTLYGHDVEVADNSCQTHLHYALELIEKGATEKDTLKKHEYLIKCLEQFRTSIRIKDLNPEAYFGIGYAYQRFGGSVDSTIIYCKLSIYESSIFYKPYKILGTAYESIDKQRLASYYYNKAVELNPYDVEAVGNLKTHIKNTGLNIKDLSSAENNDAGQSEEQNEDYIRYRDMGKAYGQKGDYQNALKYLQKAVEIKPRGAEALVNLAVCYGLMNNYQKNIETLNTMLVIYPNSTIALQNLVTTYERMGNKTMADEYRKKIDSLNNK